MRTWIKICGTTCLEDAQASIAAGADALGFVFAPSKRRISPEQARQIVAQLPVTVERIGVFADETADRIAEIFEHAGLTGVQLHGVETPAFSRVLRNKLQSRGLRSLIKTVLVNDDFESRFAEVCNQDSGIDFVLLDSGGGTGHTFHWQTVQPLLGQNHKRLIVAGGLHADNVGEAIRRFSPWGVDVVSAVEKEPRRKDPEKLQAFVKAVREAERS